MRKVFFIFKWMLTITFLVILLIFTNHMQSSQKIHLKDITIKKSDSDFLDKKNILNYLKVQSVYIDNHLVASFSKNKLENLLASHSAVKEVEVFANQKGDLEILIEQKEALVRIKSNTDDYYLDEFGNRMELSDRFTPELVVVTGDIKVQDHSGIYKFINQINKSDFWNAQITQIHFENDDIFLIPRVGNHKINFGNFENIIEKLDNLYQFYKISMPLKGWETYAQINLKFKNQIVCTKK